MKSVRGGQGAAWVCEGLGWAVGDCCVFNEAKRWVKTVATYGAVAEGNTLINHADIWPDLISFVVDRSPAKQDKNIPGSHSVIVDKPRLQQEKPDYVVILPWNLKAQIMLRLEYVRTWSGLFVTAVPALRITS